MFWFEWIWSWWHFALHLNMIRGSDDCDLFRFFHVFSRYYNLICFISVACIDIVLHEWNLSKVGNKNQFIHGAMACKQTSKWVNEWINQSNSINVLWKFDQNCQKKLVILLHVTHKTHGFDSIKPIHTTCIVILISSLNMRSFKLLHCT